MFQYFNTRFLTAAPIAEDGEFLSLTPGIEEEQLPTANLREVANNGLQVLRSGLYLASSIYMLVGIIADESSTSYSIVDVTEQTQSSIKDLANCSKRLMHSIKSYCSQKIEEPQNHQFDMDYIYFMLQQIQNAIIEKSIFKLVDINPYLFIEENELSKTVAMFEEIDTSQALLTAGLFLSSIATMERASAYNRERNEKLSHDAISFLDKASQDKDLKEIIDFILWEMRIVSPHESIRLRLSQYDIPLPNIASELSVEKRAVAFMLPRFWNSNSLNQLTDQGSNKNVMCPM